MWKEEDGLGGHGEGGGGEESVLIDGCLQGGKARVRSLRDSKRLDSVPLASGDCRWERIGSTQLESAPAKLSGTLVALNSIQSQTAFALRFKGRGLGPQHVTLKRTATYR